MRRILLASMLLLISGTAHAAGPAPATAPAPAQPTAPEAIQIDQKTGAIRFVVNGREEARIDAKGLHVRGDIEHGGVEKDIGQEPGAPPAGVLPCCSRRSPGGRNDQLAAPEPKH